ncbi:hypothetical protein COCNU_scaffold000057G000010 [Cocos nucifera]|nr:hypothetical protein [Cocos nucifera]
MAPKKRSLTAQRPSVIPSTEARAKQQCDMAQSSPSASSSHAWLFIATRIVPIGRCVYIAYLDREHFYIGSWIQQPEALKCVLERKEVDEHLQLVSHLLSVEMRLLLSFVSHIIFSKVGRHDWVRKRKLGVMFLMVTETPICFPSLMLQQLKDTASKSKACLPYGMIFSLIFKDFQVNLECEDFKKLAHTDYINEETLNRMKFVKKDDNWMRANEHATIKPEEHRSPPPPPSPFAGPSFTTPRSPHSPQVPPCLLQLLPQLLIKIY